jgi:hypothetical protein
MKIIKYRKIVVLGRILICLGFVLLGILLLNAAFDSDTIALRKVYYFLASIVSFLFFGRILLLMIYVLLKNSTLFSYDQSKMDVKNKEISRKDIIKVESVGEVPTGFLGTKSYGFAIHCKDKETILIPTYYVLTKKDMMEITNTLIQYVSNHKNKEIFK